MSEAVSGAVLGAVGGCSQGIAVSYYFVIAMASILIFLILAFVIAQIYVFGILRGWW